MINPPRRLHFLLLNNYTCTSPTAGLVSVANITQSQIAKWKKFCWPNIIEEWLVIIFSCVSAVIIVVSLIFLYHKRWLIKYKWFKFTKRTSSDSKMVNGQYQYDAFIAYCAEDRFWVHNILMKTLEDYYGFKLCIHYRDFPVGGLIHETIIDMIDQSREVILVMSEFFLSSEWCQFELEVSLRQANLRQSQLIVIKLGDPKFEEHLTALHVMTCHVYLEWHDEPKDRIALFWAKLVGRMYEDDHGKGSLCCCNYGARAIGYEQL